MSEEFVKFLVSMLLWFCAIVIQSKERTKIAMVADVIFTGMFWVGLISSLYWFYRVIF